MPDLERFSKRRKDETLCDAIDDNEEGNDTINSYRRGDNDLLDDLEEDLEQEIYEALNDAIDIDDDDDDGDNEDNDVGNTAEEEKLVQGKLDTVNSCTIFEICDTVKKVVYIDNSEP